MRYGPNCSPTARCRSIQTFLADLLMKNLLQVLGILHQVIFFGHHTDADYVARQRDVPEPAFFGNIGHRGGAFVDAGIALRAFIIGPHGDFIQVGVADFPAIARHEKRVAAAGVDGDGRVKLAIYAAFVDGFHACDGAIWADRLARGDLFDHLRALFARVVEQHLVQLAAQHLPGLRGLMLQVGVKIKRLGGAAVFAHKLDAELFHEMRLLDFVQHA